jgi:putative ABC transport system permease protein
MSNRDARHSSGSRTLFWRIWFRSISGKRSQAALALTSLLVGAALAAALLNLHSGIQRKMTEEFQSYGANVVLAPGSAAGASERAPLMDEAVLERLAAGPGRRSGMAVAPMLNAVMRISRVPADPRLPEFENVVAVGTNFSALRAIYPGWRIEGSTELGGNAACVVGAHVARRLHARTGDAIRLAPDEAPAGDATRAQHVFPIAGILSTGAAEDDQVFVPLDALQQMTGLAGRISLVELNVPGDPAEIERTVQALGKELPGVEVRAVRSVVESEGKVLGTIRGLLVSLTALIIGIVALCMVATMTTIVLERKRDIAVMKALGATDRLIARLFLSESAALGVLGGLAGFGVGFVAARILGQRLFEVAIGPAWWTLPTVCVATAALAVATTALPVRIARAIEPAAVLKGE